MFICVIGVGTNIINIVVFIQIEIRDSVTVAFFSLAVADFGFVFLTIVYQVLESLELIARLTANSSLLQLSYFFNYTSFVFVDISILITVFTSLQKCACVAIPFLFKKVFTFYRSTVVISTIYVLVVIAYIPIFVGSALGRGSFFEPPLTMYRVALPFSAIVLLTGSLIITNIKLLEASRIRQGMTSRHDNSNLSTNELKVIKAIVIISAMFVACNLPDIVSMLAEYLFPAFNFDGAFCEEFRLVRAAQNVLAAINSTATIFVYYKYNNKYRARFLVLYGRFWCQAERN
ncbi:hypothetical protein BsWGS_13247 [Bradybaena similaris]